MKVAVCDDDNIIAKKIAQIIENVSIRDNIESEVAVYNSGSELLKAHEARKFDVIFLDIDMPGFSGFDVAKQLREQFYRCQIIFVTNYSEFVYKSFDFQPFNFIQKNSSTIINDIEQVLKKLVKFFKQDKRLYLKDKNDNKILVPIRDIIYIKSSGHYVYYNVKGKGENYRSRQTIKV